ncbi:hypothetical protein FRB98_008495 [Tulasnella sp. 332]|nr:hypothetical protein FRB98_008495 [Tulasnella sp. 332]
MLDESSDQESESECNSPAESDIDQELSMEYFCGLTLEMQTMFAEADSLETSTCFAIYTKILAVLLATSKRAASFAASVGQTFSSIFPAIFTTFYTMAHSVVWATQTIYTALLTCFEAIFTVFIIYKLIRQLTWRLNDHKGKRTIMGAVHAMLSKFLRAFVMHVAARVLVLVLVLVAAGLGVVWMVHCV